MDSFIRTPLPYKVIFEAITNKEMTSAKELSPLSDLNVRQNFLIQQYMIYFKKAMNTEEMLISEQLSMNRQEQRLREKNFENETP